MHLRNYASKVGVYVDASNVYRCGGCRMQYDLACGGDGGNGNPSATAPQRGGDGGCLWLMASGDLILSGQQRAGQGGQGTGGGANGRKGCVVIDPTTISVTDSAEVNGEDVTIFSGNDWVLDLRNLNSGAISATGNITLAVGSGGSIDLRGNTGQVMQTAGQVMIAADTITLDAGVSLSTVVGPNVQTTYGQILNQMALVGPGQSIGQPGVTLPLDLTILNNGPIQETYLLSSSDSAGWSLSGLPTSITVNGLGLNDLILNVIPPPTVTGDEQNLITITAVSQANPNIVALAQVEVIVDKGEKIIYLPLIIKN